MKKTQRLQVPAKLRLDRQTVRVLSADEVRQLVGGQKPTCTMEEPASCHITIPTE